MCFSPWCQHTVGSRLWLHSACVSGTMTGPQWCDPEGCRGRRVPNCDLSWYLSASGNASTNLFASIILLGERENKRTTTLVCCCTFTVQSQARGGSWTQASLPYCSVHREGPACHCAVWHGWLNRKD